MNWLKFKKYLYFTLVVVIFILCLLLFFSEGNSKIEISLFWMLWFIYTMWSLMITPGTFAMYTNKLKTKNPSLYKKLKSIKDFINF